MCNHNYDQKAIFTTGEFLLAPLSKAIHFLEMKKLPKGSFCI
jgi:hypothetical protein